MRSLSAHALLAASFNQAPIGIALLDPAGRWLHVNDALCKILGYSRVELLELTFQDITHPDDLHADLELLHEVLAGTRTGYGMEKRYFRKDGQLVWVQLTATLVRDEAGAPRCFISHIEDVTDRVYDRECMRALSERLQLATGAARMGVLDYHIPTRRAHWDDRMFAIYGMEPSPDGLVEFEPWTSHVHPEDLAETVRRLRETITEGTPLDMSYRIMHPTNGLRILHVTGQVTRDAEGRPLRCVAVTHDITEQSRAQDELQAAKEAAEAASHAKSAFLAMMSHEIRTPLHGIIGHTHLLADSAVTEEQASHLATIATSGDALLTIIEDILDYSKIEAGKMRLENVTFSIKECVDASVATLSPRAAAKQLVLNARIASDVPAYVIGDQMRLRQVLTNFLSNAVKFTHLGEVSLQVSRLVLAGGEPGLHFHITDTGIGIAEAQIADLFQPFRQLDASITRRFGGTGLGLAICRGLVQSMGGTLDLASREGEGTEVHVRIPFRPAVEVNKLVGTAGDPTIKADRFSKGFPTLAPEVCSWRILVAEDNPINRRLIQQMLARLGAPKVEMVNDGAEAVERFLAETFDVIIMDCQMPLMDGYEAAREIRRIETTTPRRNRICILALTASAFDEDRKRAFASGMDDFLTKPLHPRELADALNRAVLS